MKTAAEEMTTETNQPKEESQNQNPKPENEAASSAQFSSDHFASDSAIPTIEAEIVDGPPPPKFLNKDEFFGTFELCFGVAGGITKLQSFPISRDNETERMQAQVASDGVYDICERHEQLHFLIDRDSVYLKAAAAIGPFAMAKHAALKAELTDRRNALKAEKKDDE